MAINLQSLLQKTHLLHPDQIQDKTCPVCYEDYLHHPSREFPRRLPCGHVLGTECLLLWVSSQSHEKSIKCPWCRREIIRSINNKEGNVAEVRRYTEAALTYVMTQFSTTIDAVDWALEHDKCGVLALALLVAAPALYFDGRYIKLPFRFLEIIVTVALERRLKPHPRYGVVLMVLGLCVGIFLNRHAGRVLFRIGKAPFNEWIEKAFLMRFRLLFATAFLVPVLSQIPRVSGLKLVAVEAEMQVVGTLWHLGFLGDTIEIG